jgi:hypothetical protein
VTTIAARALYEAFEQRDAVDVEMVGGLVQQQQVRLERQRERQRSALDFAAGRALRRRRLVEPESMQVFGQPRVDAPAIALVGDVGEPAALHEALAERRCAGQLWLLLDEHDRRPFRALDAAVVQREPAGDREQQRRLPGAVATDQPDSFARVDGEVGAIEQRMQSERELGIADRQQRHDRVARKSPFAGNPGR